MHRGFGGTAFEEAEEKRDRELTVGPMALAFLGLVFCGICALCFVWGYSVGHRAPVAEAVQPAANGPSAAQLLSSQPKPTASENNLTQRTGAQAAVGAAPAGTGSPGSVPALVSSTSAGSGGSGPNGGAVVQAALPAQASTAHASGSTGAVQPALGGNWMVQIAAVSHSEDADVLVSALRKRGYAVSAHRDPGDNLIHVQVGPFATHADAGSMRQRLLNDGYNAIIEP